MPQHVVDLAINNIIAIANALSFGCHKFADYGSYTDLICMHVIINDFCILL